MFLHGTLDLVHADVKGNVSLWLSVNNKDQIYIQMYTVESDLTKQAECHVFIVITVIISLNTLLTMFATRVFCFLSGFPGMVRGSQYKGLLS